MSSPAGSSPEADTPLFLWWMEELGLDPIMLVGLTVNVESPEELQASGALRGAGKQYGSSRVFGLIEDD